MLKPVAPVLALAGDLGQPDRRAYRDLMHYCSRNWSKVFVVAGNHEFYHREKTVTQLLDARKTVFQTCILWTAHA